MLQQVPLSDGKTKKKSVCVYEKHIHTAWNAYKNIRHCTQTFACISLCIGWIRLASPSHGDHADELCSYWPRNDDTTLFSIFGQTHKRTDAQPHKHETQSGGQQSTATHHYAFNYTRNIYLERVMCSLNITHGAQFLSPASCADFVRLFLGV